MGDMMDTLLQRVLAGLATGLIIDGLGTVVSGDRYSGWGLNQLPGWSRSAVENTLDALPVSRRIAGLAEVVAGIVLILVIARLGADKAAEDAIENDTDASV